MHKPNNDKPSNDFGLLEGLMMQAVAWRAVLHSLRLGLFDALDLEPVTAGRLAERFGFLPGPAEALLELLAAHGLVVSGPDGYRNTPVASEYLVGDSPFFQGKALELNDRFNTSVDADFLGLLRGETSARGLTDDGWSTADTMQGTAQYARLGSLQDTVDFVADLPGFMDMRLTCDVGGNHGSFSMALLDRNPSLRGEIADLPSVAATANDRIAGLGYAHRLRAFGCDLRSDALSKDRYDLVLASHVLYGFMDDLGALLRKVHEALLPGGWFVAQHKDPDGGRSHQVSMSLEFLTRMAGYATHFIPREFLEEHLLKAGFRDIRARVAGPHDSGLIVAGRRP